MTRVLRFIGGCIVVTGAALAIYGWMVLLDAMMAG